MSRPLVIGVVGPTASGKSGVAVELARRFAGEVVSVDSVQVYRSLDIGTGKITADECRGVTHHLIDVVDPDEPYEASRFQQDADEAIASIVCRGHTVFLAGGTGLYLRALLQGLFDAPPQDAALRQQLQQEAEELGRPALHERLRQIDPEAAAKISPNDLVRISRALEVWQLTGKRFSEFAREHGHREERYPSLLLGLNPPRAQLFEKIHRRVDQMLADGWIDEIKELYDRGYGPQLKPLQSLGYRELGEHLAGNLSLGEAVTLTKKNTRAFARRQLTWFRKEPQLRWFSSPEELLDDPSLHKELQQLLRAPPGA